MRGQLLHLVLQCQDNPKGKYVYLPSRKKSKTARCIKQKCPQFPNHLCYSWTFLLFCFSMKNLHHKMCFSPFQLAAQTIHRAVRFFSYCPSSTDIHIPDLGRAAFPIILHLYFLPPCVHITGNNITTPRWQPAPLSNKRPELVIFSSKCIFLLVTQTTTRRSLFYLHLFMRNPRKTKCNEK